MLAHQFPVYISKLVLISVGAPVSLSPHPGCLRLPVCCLTCLRPMIVYILVRFTFSHVASRDLNSHSSFWRFRR